VVVPDPVGGFALDLPRGRVRLLPDSVVRDMTVPTLPCIAGIHVHTADANAAATRLVAEHGIAHRVVNSELIVDLSAAGRVTPRFTSAP
jgi:hypothetical protein